MIYPRDLIKEIEPFLKRKEFIAIIGPRQSGKSTFLSIIKDYLNKELGINGESVQSVTFEDRKLLSQFEADPVSFVRSYMPEAGKHPLYLMIDEFQYARSGGQKLKLLYDTVENLKIIITGSSSLDIKAQVGKYMVGRILTFYLFPFNFEESLRTCDKRLEKIYRQGNSLIRAWLSGARSIKIKSGADVFSAEMIKHYEKYCIWGGYPAVVLAKNEKEKRKLLEDIYNNYVLKDIKTLLELATENNLYLLSQYLSAQIGNIIIYNNLGQAAGLDYRGVKKHLNILRETFICSEVKPFFVNRQKELSKNPKMYFIDLGFRNNLMENMNNLNKRPDAGAVVENTVFVRLNELGRGGGKINFWRTKAGAEVDFILHEGGRIIPIEAKYSDFRAEKVPRGLASFIDAFKPEKAIVLTKNLWGYVKKGKTKILFCPVYYL